ncbi:MAG: hypothetical protein OXE53_13020 [Deltaproteobacteria bacterium]|nr:hypothetical protein [Deltaproteobacteria bacterium]
MWIRTTSGAYINVSLIELFAIVDQAEADGKWYVTAYTNVPNEGEPFTQYELYGPRESHEEAQEVLDKLVKRIHEALYPARKLRKQAQERAG